MGNIPLVNLLEQVRGCSLCAPHLAHSPRPVLRASNEARLLIIGQAPGTKVHATGIPWNDPSGDRLRDWLGMDKQSFYDESQVAIIPMGFCYPGKGKSGDLPPRPECAPQWHSLLFDQLPKIQLTLLIGQYAQRYYLESQPPTLTETVQCWRDYLPKYFVLPHPSPRNQLWLKKNLWFTRDVLPDLKSRIQRCF